MILAVEMMWTGTVHAPVNSALIQCVARAYPRQDVRVLAVASHVTELGRDPELTRLGNVSFRPVRISPLFPGKTHVVSARRFGREFAVLRDAVRSVPADEPCLLVLLSATPTAVFAAALLLRLARRRLGVQVALHGNLNELTGWRPRNPLTRSFDLAAAMSARHPSRLRFLVLEPSIKDRLARIAPRGAARTDVLPHPVNPGEMPDRATSELGEPLRIGFVGQATQAKGFDLFLAIARELTARHGSRVAFHLVGRAVPGADLAPLAVLADPATAEHLSRAEFVRRLAGLHYVLLPFQDVYYALSASGALLDAITWLKPVIATRLPIVQDVFERFGDIGVLCDDGPALREAVEALLADRDAARYRRQVANLAAARESRTPRSLAAGYRSIVARGFDGLLG